MNDWISVKDKEPEGDILAYIEYPMDILRGPFFETGIAIVHRNERWFLNDTIQTCVEVNGEHAFYGEITYWMPLPEPPEEDK